VSEFMPEGDQRPKQPKIQKVNLFECLLKVDLTQQKYKFNVPETVLFDEDRKLIMLTTEKDVVVKKNINKIDTFSVFETAHSGSLNRVKASISKKVYEEMY
jgi:hypothetical protein